MGNINFGGAVATNEPHLTSLMSGLTSLTHTSSHGENAQCRLNWRENDENLRWLAFEVGPGPLLVTFKHYHGCPLMISNVSTDGNGYGKLENRDMIMGIDDVLVCDFDAKKLEVMIKTRESNETRTITVLRYKNVPSKHLPKKRKHHPFSPLLRGFFVYFRSERITGDSLKKTGHHIILLWQKFLSLTDAEHKRWINDYTLDKMNHEKKLKSQNDISTNNGGQKRPLRSFDLYVANYKAMVPSATRQTMISEWNKLSDRSVWENLRVERQHLRVVVRSTRSMTDGGLARERVSITFPLTKTSKNSMQIFVALVKAKNDQ